MQRQRSRLLLVLVSASLGCSLNRNAHIAPAADVDIDARVLAEFQEEVEDYRILDFIKDAVPDPAVPR